ncbi:chitosanase [Streptomyces apocyni]|uniref:chitosanase n=1 Tax=Streptomyces apocyni TaxID=2654677 RepID=UPI0012E9D8A7|nr:chitosanase [Streptomyces apocyni]
MKRASCLFFAIAPLATLAVFLWGPSSGSDDFRSKNKESGQSETGGTGGTADWERDKKTAESDALDERIAKLPPGLAAPDKRELALQLVSTAHGSALDWQEMYGSISDSGEGAGYCAGIAGFCSGTNDMLALVKAYTKEQPDNELASYLPALREVNGSDSHEGLDPDYPEAWADEAEKPAMRKAQDAALDRLYFKPAVRIAKIDGLGTLGQFMYFDAMLQHGPGADESGFYSIRRAAMKKADTKAAGGDEKAYLEAFLDIRRDVIKQAKRTSQRDTSRIDNAQRVFLRDGNLELKTPLTWEMYGDTFRVP